MSATRPPKGLPPLPPRKKKGEAGGRFEDLELHLV